MAIQDPLAVFCALLDRSVQQIAEACADARVFDRHLIVDVSDVWDNNTFPLFRAAFGADGQSADARALTGLLWMAEFRREWMVEQAAVAGYALDEELPPVTFGGPYRDYAGQVRPWRHPLTADVVEEVAADYDLAAAHLTSFQAERAGRCLEANATLTVPRRFSADTSAPAKIGLGLVDVTGLQVAADPAPPLRATAEHFAPRRRPMEHQRPERPRTVDLRHPDRGLPSRPLPPPLAPQQPGPEPPRPEQQRRQARRVVEHDEVLEAMHAATAADLHRRVA